MFRRFVIFIATTLPLAAAPPDVHVVEEIAAKVNGDIITRGELDEQRKEVEQMLRSQGYTGQRLTDAVKQYSSNALRDQIDQLLLVHKGKDLNLDVAPEVNRELADLQVQSKITDPDKFHEYVHQQTGMDFVDYKDRLTKQFLAQRVIGQEVGYRINIPDADLQKYYGEHKNEFVRKEQVFLSQLLISTEGKTPEQAAAAEKKAKDLVARGRKGEKFNDLVKDNSDDPETARNGGVLPPYQRGMMPKNMEDVVFNKNNPKGYVTDPFKVPQGFVILRIDERYEAGLATFEEVKPEIEDALRKPRMEPMIRTYLTKLRQESFLEIKDGYTDSGAAPGKDTRWKDVAELKPQTTTKEEVAAHARPKKKLLGIPLPGTHKKPAFTDNPTTPAAPAAAPATAPSTPPAAPSSK